MSRFSRREFLGSAAVFSALGLAPRFLTAAAAPPEPALASGPDQRILVVVQLGGGNDGLNTLVPYADDNYHRLRPRLAKRDVLRIDDTLGFNARLTGLMDLYDDGRLAVVQGVGYPNPDRSHFRSMEIWHTASDSDTYATHGWLGRYFDNYCSGRAPQVGLAVDRERPQAFDGAQGFGIATDNPAGFGWEPGPTGATAQQFAALNDAHAAAHHDTLDFLRLTTTHAIDSAAAVRAAAERGAVDRQRMPQRGMNQLQVVAGLIRGGLDTRIYYVSTGGFDTHANQAGQHDNLLENVGEALAEFQATLRRDGTADRVTTLVFSEFGRRVAENGSGGTDHGTAAPMFLLGEGVRPGLHGAAPSLETLDNGDLIHTVDFRAVYSRVLADWLGANPDPVLGRDFGGPALFA